MGIQSYTTVGALVKELGAHVGFQTGTTGTGGQRGVRLTFGGHYDNGATETQK